MMGAEREDALRAYLARPTPSGLAQVYAGYRSFCVAQALAITGDPASAEDITHTVFLELIGLRPTPGGYERPEAFLAQRIHYRHGTPPSYHVSL